MPFKITEVYAFIAVGEDGEEGVTAFMNGATWVPMVAADAARLKSLRPVAQMIAETENIEIKIAKFTTREDLEVIK